MPKIIRAVNYGRESQGNPYSIDQQLRDGRNEAEQEGYQIIAEFQDAVGASKFSGVQRDAWPKTLELIESGKVDVILLREVARANRRAGEWLVFLELCAEQGVLIRSTSKHRTYDPKEDWASLAQDGVYAEHEARIISRRSRDGHRNSFDNGMPATGRTPYGYRRDFRKEGRRLVTFQEPDPATAGIVRRLFQEVADGTSMSALAAKLNAEGVPHPEIGSRRTKDGEVSIAVQQWYPQRIRMMLRNKAYIGMRVHRPRDKNGRVKETRVTEGNWPAIVDAELFETVQQILDGNREAHQRPGRLDTSKYEYLLSGAVKCDECVKAGKHEMLSWVRGHGMYETRKDGTRLDRRGYMCPDRKNHARCKAQDAERYILDALNRYLADPDVQHQLKERTTKTSAEAQAIDNELAKLRLRLEAARDSAASVDGISYEALAVQERKLGAEITRLESELDAVSLPPVVRVLTFNNRFDQTGHQNFITNWADLPLSARRAVIRDLMDIRLLPAGRQGKRLPIEQRITYTFKLTPDYTDPLREAPQEAIPVQPVGLKESDA